MSVLWLLFIYMFFLSRGKQSLFALYTRRCSLIDMQHNKEMLQHLLRCDAVGGILRTVRHDTLVLSDYPAWSSHMEHIVKKQFPHVTVHLRSSSRSLSGFEIDFVFTSYQTQVCFMARE